MISRQIRQHLISALLILTTPIFAKASEAEDWQSWNSGDEFEELVYPFACKKANKAQKNVVDRGNQLANEFYQQCLSNTGSQKWCVQVMRPNPDSAGIFECTYGTTQVHQLVNPDKKTWPNAFKAVRLVQELEAAGIKPCLIYNWWRPEPYNQNVGGAAGRHPTGTSVDVRFCSMPEMELAFLSLCSSRSQGKLRALGYYGTTGLHLGVGDKVPNTWGKSCPS